MAAALAENSLKRNINMKKYLLFAGIISLFFLTSSPARSADDFDLILGNIDLHAEANIGNFKTSLQTSFGATSRDIDVVFKQVTRPAEAYMCLRIAKLSRSSVQTVLEEYRKNHKKGWGHIAKNLGIKPGSKAFHALKENPYASKGEKAKKNKGKKD